MMQKSTRKINIFALVTARGGSKGIPGKNIRQLAGKPLIAWTIESALKARTIERVIVSTDDPEIAKTAQKYGAETPFMRPSDLAADDTPHFAVLEHCIDWLRKQGKSMPDYLLTLQPTSPLRTAEDIDKAVMLAAKTGADAVIGVCEPGYHPYLTKMVDEDGLLKDFIPKKPDYLQRQVFPEAYAINGAIYLNRIASLLEDKTMFPKNSFGYIMPRKRSWDIDEAWELGVAEFLLTGGGTCLD